MDGGAWWAAVHGVAKSRARLSDFTFTFHFHALEKEMATHSSILAGRIPGTEEPSGLPSMGSHRVGHNSSDLAAASYSSTTAHSSSNTASESSGKVKFKNKIKLEDLKKKKKRILRSVISALHFLMKAPMSHKTYIKQIYMLFSCLISMVTQFGHIFFQSSISQFERNCW